MMFIAPAQPPAISYPHAYRIKRKPVPSLDFDFRNSESDLKKPVISNRTAITRNSVDAASDLPRLSNRKPALPRALPTPASLLATAGDTNHTVHSRSKGHRSLDLKTHSVDVALIRDASVRRHSECYVEPYYHRRAQLMSAAAPSQATLSSNPTPPYVYSHLRFDLTRSSLFFPSPILEIGRESVAPIDTAATHDSAVNLSPSQNRSSGSCRGRDLSFPSPHRKNASEGVSASLTRPKELKHAWLLRPIRMSLGMDMRDDPQSESGCHKTTRQCYSGSTGQDRLSNPMSRPPHKRNVLRARRGRSLSLSSATPGTKGSGVPILPPAKLGVDAKPRNLSQQKALVPSLSPELATDSSQKILSALPQTSSGHASPGRRTRSHSQQLTCLVRPTTAPAASVPFIKVNRKPTQKQLSEAASLLVVAENGVRVSFGDLFLARKTAVIFIRHFWCPNCQDYMSSISNTVSPAALKQAGINLVIISNGSYNMIQSYRKIFHTPFAVYTDPTHRVYNALGMTLRTMDAGPESRKGAYAKHGVAQGIAMVLLNGIKTKMPLLGKGGDVEQLGGEFVLGPGLKCSFAHRMHTTRSHTPIQRVLAAAGLDLCARWEQPTSSSEKLHLMMSEADEAKWMDARNQCLATLRVKKDFRRAGEAPCGVDAIYEVPLESRKLTVSASLTVDGGVGMPKTVTTRNGTLEVVEQTEEELRNRSHGKMVDSYDTSPTSTCTMANHSIIPPHIESTT